jgi:parallel beta-helix repeat protein
VLTEENVIKMNKVILASFTILCLLSVPLMMEGNMSVKADSKIWYVDDDNVSGPWNGTKEYPYQNITSALEHALDGDTVFVYNGTYCENIDVDKSVSLVGEDRDSTVVNGSGTGTVISMTAGNVKIKGFTIKGSGPHGADSGIFAREFSGNEISHNTITNNSDGIHFESSSGNVISDNIISFNNNHGIYLAVSSNLISGNTIANNDNGIDLWLSRGNVISGNIISSNNEGISLDRTSGDSIIYHNNFNNTDQVESISSNSWDYDDEGNYWSDYNGTDKNQDGVGDTPYIIDESNRDNYPLMGMFSDLIFTFNGETYHTNVISNSTISHLRFEIGQETGNKIVRFYAAGGSGTVGFCRVAIPIELMNYSYIILDGVEEIVPTKLNVSSETFAYLYFTYIRNSHTISIISSKTMQRYYEILDKYHILLDKYIKLETDLYDQNATYQELLNNYTVFLGNYNVFLTDYSELQKSYQELLLDYSEKVNDIQNLMYIFAATTAIFIITTIYLSRSAHASEAKVSEEARKKRTP